MKKEIEQDETIPVRCNCGQRLFDMERSAAASVSIKCQNCRAVMVVTMKNQKYRCIDKRMMAYTNAFSKKAMR